MRVRRRIAELCFLPFFCTTKRAERSAPVAGIQSIIATLFRCLFLAAKKIAQSA